MNIRAKNISAGIIIILMTVGVISGCGHSETKIESNALNLRTSIASVMTKYKFPALGAAIITSNSIDTAVLGVRKANTNNTVSQNDKFHIGSCGKAMTDTMIGILVSQGKLSWTTTPADVFPDLASGFNSEYSQTTLEQLLNFEAGVPAFDEDESINTIPSFTGTVHEQRRQFTAWVLDQAPAATAGTFIYSNASIAIAAAMAEEVTGKSWEELMNTYLFTPLGITPTYGWAAASDTSGQPWGHRLVLGTVTANDPTGTIAKMPTVLAPAGDMSFSIHDWAVFVQMHLRTLRGQSTIVPAAIMEKLHTPVNDYAMGWVVHDYNGSRIHWHTGSDGTFYSYALIRPGDDKAYIIFTNAVIDELTAESETNTNKGFDLLLTKIVGTGKFLPLSE